LQYIISNPQAISHRLESFLGYLSSQEMQYIFDDAENDDIAANYPCAKAMHTKRYLAFAD